MNGRTSVYRQVAGFYDIQRQIGLRGEEETFSYYGQGMNSKCAEINLADALSHIQAAIAVLPNTGVDTGQDRVASPRDQSRRTGP